MYSEGTKQRRYYISTGNTRAIRPVTWNHTLGHTIIANYLHCLNCCRPIEHRYLKCSSSRASSRIAIIGRERISIHINLEPHSLANWRWIMLQIPLSDFEPRNPKYSFSATINYNQSPSIHLQSFSSTISLNQSIIFPRVKISNKT